tara:strand:- start:1392 stop:1901 length:510 start_codon:yes stop_codon:yes gene_type:complete
MRLKEFKVDERQKLKEMYPHLTEEQLDEILPALGAAAGVAGRALATGAMTAGRVGAKMGTAAAKGAGKLAVKGATAGAKAGANLAGSAAKGIGTQLAKSAADVGVKLGVMAAQKLLKVGNKLNVGGQEVKVDAVSGDEVTFADPKKRDAPKTVIKKKNPIVQNALKSLV